MPEIPSITKGSVDDVFCIGLCFMGIHYWQELQSIYNDTKRETR